MDLVRLYKERKIGNSYDFEWLKQVSRRERTPPLASFVPVVEFILCC